ncbi:RNA-binding protein RO60-like [Hydractinia symbiolongicarpus]|uniref:RNA-binding protein RO60-like n=1 Tax=Hydractinia symbiolongicarpus TaxID=13093 RepID=UPI00254D885E|nr:RNA-binding protein RO60-like [Hydractinia symbiolongicarpus]XP_057299955.1 RNA-binding protein RO60-like [Hydractinia symbiolongicarpus]
MADTLKSWFGMGKKDSDETMIDVQQKLAQLSKNVDSYDATELAAQLEKITKTLSSQAKVNDPVTDSGDQEPPMTSTVYKLKPFSTTPIPQSMPYNERQVMNSAGGYSFQVCDFMKLKRFLVIGSESGTYYTTSKDILFDSVQCVKRLIKQGHGQAVLDLLEEYSTAGRIANEKPILTSLMTCAMSADTEIQQATYKKISTICNIPTKLFFFLDLCQTAINARRASNPPQPQPQKKKEVLLKSMKIESKGPSENVDTSIEPSPAKKQRRMKKTEQKFKKVNVTPKKSSGWGRMRRKGIASFYTDEKKDANRLLYLVTKYKSRHNWSHKQVLGYAHPKMEGEEKVAKDLVLTYCARGYQKYKLVADKYASTPGISNIVSEVIAHIDVLHKVSLLSYEKEGDEEQLLEYLKKYGRRNEHDDFTILPYPRSLEPAPNSNGRRVPFQLVREHIPTNFLKSKKVWEAMLLDMPMTAMIRNLGKMSSLGLFQESGEENANVSIIKAALSDVNRLKKAKIHPIKILLALRVYQTGRGDKGDLTWPVNEEICTALDAAFYLTFRSTDLSKNFKTGKKFMLCLDVSGSMTWQGCYGCENMTPAMASMAMAMVTWNIEEECEIMAFGGQFVSLKEKVKRDMTLNEALRATSRMNFGSTDCSLPMQYALQENLDIDVFIVYTDSDTWSGRIHPPIALRKYNAAKGKNAKLIVCAMQTNDFTIADPNDPNMMDICGFDTSVPDIISEFAKDTLSGQCDVCTDCKAVKAKMETTVG